MEYIINGLIWGSIGIAISFLWLFIKNYRKALKDPDVKLASKLGMSMPIYRDCQELFEERQKWFSENQNGNFDNMPKRMPQNPNAYRKYEQYRFFIKDVEKWEQYSDDMKSMLEFDNPYKKEEYQWLRKLNII
jgi:hypothetical protein